MHGTQEIQHNSRRTLMIDPERLQARAQSAPWNRSIEIMLAHTAVDGAYSTVTDMTLKLCPPGNAPPCSLSLDMDDAQTLMDDLWKCGLRPTEGAGSAGSLAATERHLADMKRLVFDYHTRKVT